MASQWFYRVMGERFGPVSSTSCKASASVAWFWLTLRSLTAPMARGCRRRVRGLFGEPNKMPLPAPAATANARPADSSAASQGRDPNAGPRMSRLSPRAVAITLAGSFGVVVLIGSIIVVTRSKSQKRQSESRAVSTSQSEQAPVDFCSRDTGACCRAVRESNLLAGTAAIREADKRNPRENVAALRRKAHSDGVR